MDHHARLYIGQSLHTVGLPSEVGIQGTDVDHIIVDTLTIGVVRAVIDTAHQTPLERPVRDFVLLAKRCTHEAQNALLKVLEEPPATARFHLVVPSESVLLPTVLSRLQLAPAEGGQGSKGEVDVRASEFIQATYAGRLELVQALAKKKETERMRSLVVETVAHILHTDTAERPSAGAQSGMNSVVMYAQQPGASLKMLLEYLALLVPTVRNK